MLKVKRGGTRENVWDARFNRAAICTFLLIAVIYGGAKTNGVGNIPPQLMSPPPVVATVSPEDIARGWRVEGVATNAGASYAMPDGVSPTFNWHRRGTFGEWRRLDLGDFAFPFGTNGATVASFSVFSDGRMRPTPRDAGREIRAVGVPMLAVQGASRFWTADGAGGAKLLTWESFFLGADTNAPVSAQVELRPSGDFVTRSNGVETVCRRVNPDDWDGDGLHNERDARPTSSDGDHFGAANALPAGANEGAYYWLDVCATGGLGVATVRVTCDGPSDLGDHVVVARTNEVCHVPLLAGATYFVESDLPIVRSSVSTAYAAIETNSATALTVSLPLELYFERVAMRGGSDRYVAHTSPVDVGPRILSVSGACCSCVTNETGFSWTCGANCNCVGYWHDLAATAAWGGYSRLFGWSGWCPCAWHGQADDAPRLILGTPNTFFTNNDGGAEDSDVVRISAGLFSPVKTNGTLTLGMGLGGFVNVWTTSNRTEQVSLPVTWNVADSPCLDFFVEGAEEIERGIDCFTLTWKDGDGNAILSTNVDFAVYYPAVNVINSSLFEGGDLCNPAGIVTGTNACFALEFGAVHPPASEIRWSVVEGTANFVNGDTGERVRVESAVPGQRVTLRAQVGDSRSRPPEISAHVVEPLSVKLTVWIVGNNMGTYYATDAESVSNIVAGVNRIYEQIGVSFFIDTIDYTNNVRWLDLSENGGACNLIERRKLTDVSKNTVGLELYFVDTVAKSIVASYNSYGIVVSKMGGVETVAHEIGHAFRCADVYPTLKYDANTHLPDQTVSSRHEPMDWSNGTGCRYYKTSANQETIIRRLLMCGKNYPGRRDLSSGSVYGFSATGEDDLVDVGFFRDGVRRGIQVHR